MTDAAAADAARRRARAHRRHPVGIAAAPAGHPLAAAVLLRLRAAVPVLLDDRSPPLKSNEELYNYKEFNPFWVHSPTLANINRLLFETDYPQWLMITMTVAVASTLLSVVRQRCSRPTPSSACASRAATRLGLAIYLAYLVPPSILFIPLAIMVFKLGLYDSPLALILTYPTFLIPFCTWLLIGYFKSIPYELEECALIDGATRLQILWKITLPLAVPGLISAGIFAFTLSWNEFIYALAFIQSAENKTVPGGRPDPAGRGRRLPLGLADGRRAAGLDPGRDLLPLLRRALRLEPDRGGEGVGGGCNRQLIDIRSPL